MSSDTSIVPSRPVVTVLVIPLPEIVKEMPATTPSSLVLTRCMVPSASISSRR